MVRLTGADGVPDVELLRRALLWLAERAPPQPSLQVGGVSFVAAIA